VFWVRRGEPLRFAGGFHAFPGGRLDPADAAIPVRGAAAEAAAILACACRELFEETGVLLARGAERVPGPAREAARRALLGESSERLAKAGQPVVGQRPEPLPPTRGGSGRGGAHAPARDAGLFADFLREQRLALDAALLTRAGRWITPPFLPLRYDAHLFLSGLPEGEAPEVWPGELSGGEFIPAAEALARWARGEALLHPPNLWAITCLARNAPAQAVEAMRRPPECREHVSSRIEFQKGVFLCALRTPTLPPATHTNCWLLDLGDGGLALVDPGSGDAAELARLDALLAHLSEEGLRPRELWLTHHHPDHVGGVPALRARGLPLLAHPRTLALLGELGRGGTPVEDGALLHDRWRALHTPGHASGHLCFQDERSRALLCGDMVSTLSSIIIDPPDGDMGEYQRQLSRLLALAPRTLFPAHGSPAPNGAAKLEAYLAHRQEREDLVLAALDPPAALAEVTARAYPDVPRLALPVAERSCLATLLELEREGLAARDGERWKHG
jgi:glyoxylase-like metal-dependent hydrolase (beta-lactamase superfamily II)/8-oxo-dGTP pyrophosphatase MutT (NUDIX family)